MNLELHPHSPAHGLTLDWFEEKSSWMRRECGAPGMIDGFFDLAGRLMQYCAYDYCLLGPMFFHAVIGLEVMLRVHYRTDEKDRFSTLLSRAVNEGVIHDGIFCQVPPLVFPELLDGIFGKKRSLHPKTQAGKLAVLLPRLRNQYFHGQNLLSPDFLILALHVREAADALTMPGTPEWKR